MSFSPKKAKSPNLRAPTSPFSPTLLREETSRVAKSSQPGMSQTTVETPSQPPWPKDVTARMTYEGPPNPGSGTAAASAIKEANLQVVSITDIRSTLDVQVPGYTLDSHGVTVIKHHSAL